jgi:2-polyprenyl-3-methyl-5-hydroxy-6-metoxy-1,4-benzoquinol methylase
MRTFQTPQENLKMTENAGPGPEHIMQVGLGFWASKTLLSAVEMEVFTELAKRPEDLATLQGRLGIHPRSARDFFDTLVALGFLRRVDGRYANTPASDTYLDKHKPTYIGGMLEMANQRLYEHWSHLTTALRTGKQQNEAKDGSGSPFEAMYADPARLKTFLAAMTGISRGANLAIAKRLPWGQYLTFADVGTAQGDLAVQIALENRHLNGFGYDLAEVGPIFEEYVEQNGLSSRLRFRAGNFFEDSLPKVDVITMGHILHDWNLDEKKMLLSKAHAAVSPGGAVVIYDSIIDDDRSQNAFGLMMSLNMLIETPGGFDYTGRDCIAWMKEARFRETRVEHLLGPDSMVIGIK